MFGFFKSKEEKEQKRADESYSKMMQEIDASDKINEARIKKESADRAREFQKELDVQQNLIKAGGSLVTRERETRAALIVAINALKREEAKEKPNPIDVARCRQRVKNYFFKLVTIKRAERAFEESQLNRQWDRAMNDLSNTFKMMNEVKSGTSFMKKLVFFFRYNKVKKIEGDVYGQINDYFGSKAKPLPPDILDELEKSDPVDMMISDKLFENLNDSSSIDSCIENPEIVDIPTEELIRKAEEINRNLEDGGEGPATEIGNKNVLNAEEIDNILNR